MFQCCPDRSGFFRRALGDVVGLLFGWIVVEPNREAEGALGLGDLEAGDLEAEGFLYIVLDLLVCGRGFRGGQIQLRQVQVDFHLLLRPEFGQQTYRLTRHFFVPTPAGRSD